MGLSLGCVDFSTEPSESQVPPAPGETGTELDTQDDTGSAPDTGEDADTGADDGDTGDGGPADPDPDWAGDYSQKGSWTPGHLGDEITGSSADTLYIDTWFPSSDSGATHHYYGWPTWGFDGESFTDVSPDCSEPRPVLIHSHGNTSIRWEMFWLPEFMSTHGWIVAAPDHAGNTLYDSSEDFMTLLWRRPQDLRDTFDWLVEESENPASPLFGCVDAEAGYAVSGYSFGGYTAYVTAGALVNDDGQPTYDFSDPRVWAAVTHAPWNAYGALTTGTGAIDVPVLTLGGDYDATVGTQYQNLHSHIESTPRAVGGFATAGHYSWAPIYCSGWGDGCGSGFVDEEDFLPLVQTAVMSMLEHLRGKKGALEQMPEMADELTWELVD